MQNPHKSIHLLPNLRSSQLATLILSYTVSLEEGKAAIRQLSTTGKLYLEKNKEQIEFFTMKNDHPILIQHSQLAFIRSI